jgi:uncharacterized membrane protein
VVVLSAAPLLLAFVITVVEMTEVVALVFALSADHGSVRSGALGAVAGSAVVAAVALGFGSLLVRLPSDLLLVGAAVVLFAFGVFLLRSTVRAYRKARSTEVGSRPSPSASGSLQFAGGFSVGAVEMLETVIVLLALTAGGAGLAALVGAAVAILALVVVAFALHERVRRVKTPQLKLVATSLLFAFAVFWAGEAAGGNWPGSDLFLLPLFVLALAVVYGVVRWRSAAPVPVQTKG